MSPVSRITREFELVLLVCLLLSAFLLLMPARVLAQQPLEIVSTIPANSSTDVPLRTHPVIMFNVPVKPATLVGFVNGKPLVPFQTVFDSLNTTLTIDLGEMEYQKTYTIMIKGTLQDASGIPMSSDYTFGFTTAAGTSKRPTSTINVPTGLEPGKTYVITGKASGYVWQRDANNPLELRHWNEYGVDIGGTSMLHPTVLYFPEGYQGYKFYLIYTPYPPEPDENPCLMRSNDGVHFTSAGVTNPLFKYNTQPIYDSQNLADPEAMRIGNTSMIFYEMEQTQYAHIGVAFSTDGINYVPYGGPYSPARPMLPWPTDGNPILYPSFDTWYEQDTNPNDLNPRLGEPAVVFKDGVFHLWYSSYNVGQGSYGGLPLVVYTNASDPRGPWTKYGPVDVDGFWGHGDVVYDPERNIYAMIYLSNNPLITLTDGAINVATSPSPQGPWTNNPFNPVFSAQGGWEGSSLYRSALVEVGTQWYLYYSANPGDYQNLGSPQIGLAREVPGIRKAEISTNGGFSWTQLSVDSNGDWSFPWTPSSRGIFSIQVRVTDDWMVGTPNQVIANVDWSSQPTNPILIIVNNTVGSFGEYTGEILRAEGLNEFQMADINQVNSSFISNFDTVILTSMSLSSSQAAMIQNYVSSGGILVAFKPDSKLASVFGLTSVGTTTSEGYIKVDNTTTIGMGIVGETIQYHGVADNYNISGASVIATLYSDSATSTPYPAVTHYAYGYGETVFFAYDLPKNIIYLRQGNPEQADTETDGVPGIRPADLLAGGWLDVEKVPIPQADEQMHLLSNAIARLNLSTKPMPRLWYFPQYQKTMFVMTADSDGATTAQIYQELTDIKANGGNFSLYMTDWMGQADVQSWTAQGTDVGWHMFWPSPPSGYQAWYNTYTNTLDEFQGTYGYSLTTIRHHAIVWMGYASPARIQDAHGIYMDLNYYHYGSWLNPGDGFKNGWMTGSGIPMKFADENGTIYNSYQVGTNFPDETWNLFASTGAEAAAIAASFFDKSNNGFYSAFVGNFHPVTWTGERKNYGMTLMNYANNYGIPIWNAKQLLGFTEARNKATFENITYGLGELGFVLNLPVAVSNLTVMVPYQYGGRMLGSITLDSALQPFQIQTIGGIEYASFLVSSFSSNTRNQITALYYPDTSPPKITIVYPVNGAVVPLGTTSVPITITTNESADAKYSLTNPSFDYLTEGTNFTSGQGTLSHSFTLYGLQSGQMYHLYYKTRDAGGNINGVSTSHTFSVADETWWNTSWLYRKPVVLTERSAVALSNYQVNLNVNYVPSKMKSDFSDLMFTDSDQVTLIPYWIENYNASVSASIWVKVPSILAMSTTTIYMYYGNPSATSASNGTATFEFFDDFNDGSISSAKWVTSGIVQETGGYLQVGSGGDSIATQSATGYPLSSGPLALRSRSLVSETGSSVFAYVGLADSGLTQFALAPHSSRSYYTYNGGTEQGTTDPSGQTSYALYDIVWTESSIYYYQNGVLKATHTNPPIVPMGAYLRAYTATAYARCDWIFIHKYASVDPSSAVGPEETVKYSLTVGVSGSGVTNATGTHIYGLFTTVTIQATPNIGWKLSHWLLNGTNVGSVNPYTLNMTANFNLTAVFTQIEYILTVNVDPAGAGLVTRNSSGPYHYGDQVQLTATPSANWTFTSWSGDVSGSLNPVIITINGNKTVTAHFTAYHDVAVTEIVPYSNLVFLGNTLNVTVKVKNVGLNTESFNVTLFYNSTSIGIQTVSNLAPNSTLALHFAWNTSGLSYGYYFLNALATPASDETKLADNSLAYGNVMVTIPGDVNGDRIVDTIDSSFISAHWYPGPPIGPLGYTPNADINSDGRVDILDACIVSAHWQQQW